MKTFAVDGNWYLHRIWHTQPDAAKDLTNLLTRRFLGLICRDAMATKRDNLVVAFDGDKVFRFDIYPGYKGERGEGSKVYDYLDALTTYLAAAGIQVIHLQKYEADDVLCTIAAQGPVVIGARDKDAYQYLDAGIELYDSSFKVSGKPSPKFIRHRDIPSLLGGLSARQSLDYQTLIGDKIDCVPQIVTPAKARKGLLKHGSLQAWLSNDAEFKAELKAVKDKLTLNRKLVKLVADLPIKVKPIKWNSDLERFPQAYADYKAFCNPKSKGLF